MKVLHVWQFYQNEMKYHVHFLTKYLLENGHSVSYLAADKPNAAWKPFLQSTEFKAGVMIEEGAEVVRVPSAGFGGQLLPKNPFSYFHQISDKQPDVVHLMGLGNFFTILTLICCRFLKSPPLIVANDHSTTANQATTFLSFVYYKIMQSLYKLVGKNVRCVIVPVEDCMSILKSKFNVSNFRLIELGFSKDDYYLEEGLRNDEEKLVIGFAGKVQPAKQLEKLFDAISIGGLQDKVRCIVAGLSPTNVRYNEKLSENAKSQGVQVEFLPMLRPEDLRRHYSFVDITVFPGSISITTLEATACGAPAYIFESVSGLEHRIDEGRGQLFNSTEELAGLLNEANQLKSSNDIKHCDIAEKSKKYSWESICKKYVDLYEELSPDNMSN